jgi:hypothetical protein
MMFPGFGGTAASISEHAGGFAPLPWMKGESIIQHGSKIAYPIVRKEEKDGSAICCSMGDDYIARYSRKSATLVPSTGREFESWDHRALAR